MTGRKSFSEILRAPTVSVVLVCFNHEQYISAAVQSVLGQTYEDFELIVVDDGSSDSTFRLVKQFSDQRLRPFRQANSGPSAATNKGIESARGSFIALLSGDDVCRANRLEAQLYQLCTSNTDGVFTLPQIIDERGVLKDDSFYPLFFGKSWSSSADLFQQVFYGGNFLCGVSAFLKSEVFGKVGTFKMGSIQLQDFDMWIRVCKRFELSMMNERLVQYRIRDNNANLSNSVRGSRTDFERKVVYRAFLDDAPLSLLSHAFPSVVDTDYETSEDALDLAKSLIYLSHSDGAIRTIGAERLFYRLDHAQTREMLLRWTGMSLIDFFCLTLNLQTDHQKNGDSISGHSALWNRVDQAVAERPWARFVPVILLQKLIIGRIYKCIARSGLFDGEYYLQRYPDVRLGTWDPVQHYVEHGAFEGRDPNPLFRTSFYLGRDSTILQQGFNPLEHYIRWGAQAGLDPGPLFNTQYYISSYPDVDHSNPLLHFLKKGAREGKVCSPRPGAEEVAGWIASRNMAELCRLYD